MAVSSLDDLIKVADELGKIVLHQAKEDKHTYCVIDSLTRYEYVSTLQMPDVSVEEPAPSKGNV